MKLIAKIILVNSDKKILLALRDNNPAIPHPHHWSEIGGAVEEGETVLEALKREIKEEISCKVENIISLGEFIDSEFNLRIIMFKGTFKDCVENIELYEGEKLGLFEFEDINHLLIAPNLKKFMLEHKNEILDV